MERMNIGIIGYGAIAKNVHLPTLLRIPGVTVSAIAESDAARLAQSQQDLPQARCFADYQDLLALPDVQGVILSLPTALHAPAALSTIAGNKHLYLEKPLADDLVDARSVVDAWRESDITAMIGYNLRFHPLYQELKQQIDARVAGDLVAMRTVFHTGSGGQPAWKQKRASGGGVLLDLASHHVDLIEMLTAEPIVSVSAQLQSLQTEDDNAMVLFELANGLFVQSSFALNSFQTAYVEVTGTHGALAVDQYHSLQVEKTTWSHLYQRGYAMRRAVRNGLIATSYAREKIRAPLHDPSYENALQHFIHAAQSGTQATPTFEDGYRALTIVLAIEEAARTGRWVTISYDD